MPELVGAGEIFIHPYTPADVPRLFEAAVESIDDIFPWLPWCHPGYQREEAETCVKHCEAARRGGSSLDGPFRHLPRSLPLEADPPSATGLSSRSRSVAGQTIGKE